MHLFVAIRYGARTLLGLGWNATMIRFYSWLPKLFSSIYITKSPVLLIPLTWNFPYLLCRQHRSVLTTNFLKISPQRSMWESSSNPQRYWFDKILNSYYSHSKHTQRTNFKQTYSSKETAYHLRNYCKRTLKTSDKTVWNKVSYFFKRDISGFFHKEPFLLHW